MRSAAPRLCAALLLAQLLLAGCAAGPRYQGKRLSEWAEQLSDRDEATRNAAGSALYSSGEEGMPYLLRASGSSDVFVRLAVVDTFHEFSKHVVDAAARAQALDALLASFKDADARVRERAIQHVIDLEEGPADWLARNGDPRNDEDTASETLVRRAAAALVVALSDLDPNLQAMAAEGLGKLGKYDAAAVSSLSALLDSKDDRIRLESAVALASIGTEEAQAAVRVSQLTQFLQSERLDDLGKADAARALGLLGARAREAAPALEKAAESNGPWLRGAAGQALEQIRGE